MDNSFVPEKVCKMSDSLPFGYLIGVSQDGFSMMFYRDEKTNTKADFDYLGKLLKEEMDKSIVVINNQYYAASLLNGSKRLRIGKY